ncbi:DNA (cytosine-5-)-methyltransferase [Streptomyces sp. NPDC050617]|uniref:DNA cytosine methyltransferase n=1 Tax=Streptomyces sp. NPDC050617 TaxID=3154628 RepID=UPI0034142878
MGFSGRPLTSIEICAGAGGQAVGLHRAGFRHLALLEIDKHACETLRLNVAKHPEWKGCEVVEGDVKEVDPFKHKQLEKFGLQPGDLDLLAGGVPCPPFSLAGKQLGEDDDRDLFPRMLQLVDLLRPKAVMIENVRGILEPEHKFRPYRLRIIERLERAGYEVCGWKVLEAREFGVPQLRPRAILVAIDKKLLKDAKFEWPTATSDQDYTVAAALKKTMEARFKAHGEVGTKAYKRWLKKAKDQGGVAPTLVGGSKKHGGADLGPTRAKAAWAALGVNGLGVANDPDKCVPSRDLFTESGPMLTVSQAAIIQGFPADWQFFGGKTARYRQVGNAFPPPVAEAVGKAIVSVLRPEEQESAARDGREEQSALFHVPEPVGQEKAPLSDRIGDLERTGV